MGFVPSIELLVGDWGLRNSYWRRICMRLWRSVDLSMKIELRWTWSVLLGVGNGSTWG